jgi:hypothetical protein
LYQRFIRAYQKNAGERERLVMAVMKIACARKALNERSQAYDGYQSVIKMFDRYKLPAGSRAAEAAAKARFLLVERSLPVFEKITFNVPARKLAKTLQKKASNLKKMEQRYQAVFAYKRVQWNLAAYYRLGYLYENFADVLINAPCPRGLRGEECDIYKGQLEEYAEQPIKKAVEAFAVTLDKAKSFRTVNEWTRKSLESLNRFEPLQYPLQKEPEAAMVLDRHAPHALLNIVESGVKPEGK